jgi:hypothetical protein
MTTDVPASKQWAANELAESFRASTAERVRRILDAMLCAVVVTTAIRDEAGQIVDFRIDYANQAARDVYGAPFALRVGERLIEHYTEFSRRELFGALVRVVETGEPHLIESYSVTGVSAEPIRMSVQFSKLDDGYICSYQTWPLDPSKQEVASASATSD